MLYFHACVLHLWVITLRNVPYSTHLVIAIDVKEGHIHFGMVMTRQKVPLLRDGGHFMRLFYLTQTKPSLVSLAEVRT